MIQLPSPSMALNGAGLNAFSRYRMWNTRSVADDVTPYWLAANIASVAAGAPGGRLAALVVNCHGVVDAKGNFLALALGTGVEYADLRHFGRLRFLTKKVVITACGAARGASGRAFCAELARKVGGWVYASPMDQSCPISVGVKLLVGEIDGFEGDILRFGPAGELAKVSSLN